MLAVVSEDLTWLLAGLLTLLLARDIVAIRLLAADFPRSEGGRWRGQKLDSLVILEVASHCFYPGY